MSMTEAELLLSYVQVVRGKHNAGTVHQLGNLREWVVLIHHNGGIYFLWCAADWVKVCQGHEDMARESRKKRNREKITV